MMPRSRSLAPLALFATLACSRSQASLAAAPSQSPARTLVELQLASWISLASADHEVCALADQGWVWCWNDDGQRGFDLAAADLVGVEGVSYPTWGDSYDGSESTQPMTCALLRSGHVACWHPGDQPWPVPRLFGVADLVAGPEVVCAVIDGTHACFDSVSGPRWLYEQSSVESATSFEDFDPRQRCELSSTTAIACRVEQSDEVRQLQRDPGLTLQRVELEFGEDPFARWPGLIHREFEPFVMRLSKPERLELARAMLPGEQPACVPREDSNGYMHWASVPSAASIRDPCLHRERLGWALTQLDDADLSARLDVLLSAVADYDYASAEHLLGHVDRLPPRQRLDVLLTFNDMHPRLVASSVDSIADDDVLLLDALDAGVYEAVEWLGSAQHATRLAEFARNPKHPTPARLAALAQLEQPEHRAVFESLLDDHDCQLAMYAADALLELTGVDRRPRLDDVDRMSLDELATALCRLSWDTHDDDALAEFTRRSAGRHFEAHLEHGDFDLSEVLEAEPLGAGDPLVAEDLAFEAHSVRCSEYGELAECSFDTLVAYDVDDYAPNYSMSAALDETSTTVYFERARGRWRIAYSVDVARNDCTNC